MHNKLMPLVDKLLLPKRAIIETINDQRSDQDYSANRAYPAPQHGECHSQRPGRPGGLLAPTAQTAQTATEYLQK